MRISIITISYNQQAYLPACLESVAAQLQPGDQHIVVDPGSTDGSRDLIAHYVQTVAGAKAILGNDLGPADGLNNGFKKAVGDIQAYINADDIILPGALDYVRNFFRGHAQIDVLIGSIKIMDAFGNVKRRGRVPDMPTRSRLGAGHWQYYQQGTFFKRSAFELIGGFNIENKTCWDAELIVDLVLKDAFFCVSSRPLGAFRIHDGSITGSGLLTERYRKDRLRIREKIRHGGISSPSFLSAFYFEIESRCNPFRWVLQLRGI